MPDFETNFPAVQVSLQWLRKTFWILVIMHSKYMNEYKNRKKLMLETLSYIHETFLKFS